MITDAQGGELALQFGFNDRNELEIQGYQQPRNGKTFSADEVRASYIAASTENDDLKNDKKATVLFNDFMEASQNINQDHKTYQVFTWEEGNDQEPEPDFMKKKSDRRQEKVHCEDPDGDCPRCEGSVSVNFFPLGEKVKAKHLVGWSKPYQKRESARLRREEAKNERRTRLDAQLTKRAKRKSDRLPVRQAFAGKKYKPVALKIRPVFTEVPERFRIKRDIQGDPLQDLPDLPTNPTDFVTTGRYSQERKEVIDAIHEGDFLWPEEKKLMHNFMMEQNEAFAWDDSERGSFRHDFFLSFQ